ncbi:redoxin domain-containing protein [Reichenbachiella sp. MALMAid0571]|uniref:redoxin domain-containing protein n=1 Tax=Reichenbachiella sp. MALMAid0571 TaxID=3143939 RepID=UPI0032DF71F6
MLLRYFLVILVLTISCLDSYGQKVENIPDFSLKDVVSGKSIPFYSYKKSKAIVVIFTCNYCPYSKLYEQRIADLANEYTPKNVTFMLINSNNSSLSKDETIENMVKKAKESKFNIPYFADKQLVAKKIFQAEKTPEAFVVTDVKGTLSVVYRGAIDDNPQSPQEVENNYIKMALNNLLANKVSPVTFNRPTGCRIKTE